MDSYTREATQPGWYFSDAITITAKTGVGSSTALKGLRERLADDGRKRFVSAGAIMRSFAAQCGMTIEEFARHNAEHPDEGWDQRCDQEIALWGSQNHTIIEGRLPHVFVPHAYHVLLICSVEKRVARRQRDPGFTLLTVEAVVRLIVGRDGDDDRRYQQLYPGSLWSDEHFDLVLDTATLSPKAAVDQIITSHESWKQVNKKRIRYTITGL